MSFVKSDVNQVDGLSADVLRAIFPDPAQLHISLRPWARCLQDVHRNHGFDIVMSALRNPERDQLFLFSKTYLSLSPAYVYARARYAAPPVHRLADLAHLKVCALMGASTSYTQLPPGVVDNGANNYASLMGKLDRGYCDVLVEMKEVMFGFANLGLLSLDLNRYQVVVLPGTEKFPLHFGVGKGHPQAAQLVARLDRGIRELQRSGKLADMVAKYQLSR
jgi:polar amino acid transport system substrate-binding protein